MVQTATFEQELKSYKTNQLAATHVIQIVNNLWVNSGVELVLFRNQLIDKRGSLILRLHQQTESLTTDPVQIEESLAIAFCIQDMELPPARIDIGTLALQARGKDENEPLLEFVRKRLASVIHHPNSKPKDVVLYGFGRIGRLLAREIISNSAGTDHLRLRAVVTRDIVNYE